MSHPNVLPMKLCLIRQQKFYLKKTTLIAITSTSLGQICLLEIDACAFNTFKICKFLFLSHNNKIKKHKTRKENKPYT